MNYPAPTYRSLKKISGWLGYVDYEIFKTIISNQPSTSTAALEIGVHHGKSAIPLAFFSKDRPLYVIDVFSNQEKNIDNSGSGDKEIFIQNLKRFGIQKNKVIIDERMSSEVSAKDIRDVVGSVSFFHIDGGHHRDAILSDLKLACDVAAEDCVIAVDDMFRPEWPEVSSAIFSSSSLIDRGFKLFAIGFNKGYWCREETVEHNQSILLDNEDLSPHLHKIYSVEGRSILVFQRYPLPEWGVVSLLLWYLEIYQPLVYRPFRNLYQKARVIAKRVLKTS